MATRTRKPTAVRRTEIAEAALRLVGMHGLTALSAATLAEAVGLTSGALFRHFESLEAVLGESVALAAGRIELTFPGTSAAPVDRILAMARARVALLLNDSGVSWLLRSDEASVALPPSTMAPLKGVALKSRQFMLTAIEDGQSDRSIRGDIEAPSLLAVVMGTIHGITGRSGVDRLSPRRRREACDRALSALATLLAPCSSSRLRRPV